MSGLVLANPLGLLGLLALPLIWWLHRHVVQAQRREVSCLELWIDREQVRHEGAQRQRVPDRAVLAFELLAALLLCALLSGLDLPASAAPRPTVGLVIDGSASMSGGTGADRPIARVRAVLAELARKRPGLAVSIVLAAEHPELIGERVQDAAAADRLLAALQPQGSACHLAPALELIHALGVDAQSTLLFSDDPELSHPRLVRVGRPSANLGIVHADWRAGEAPFVVLRRFSLDGASSRDASRPVRLQLELDGAAQSTLLQLPVTGAQPFELPVAARTAKLVVSLPDDALAFDNRATLLRPLERQVSVRGEQLSPPLQAALEQALRAIPRLRATSEEGADLLVRENPTAPVARPSLVFVTRAASGAKARFVPQPVADPFAALLSGYDGRDLLWFAFGQAPPPGARALLHSGAQALIWQHAQSVVIDADLEQSNLLAHATFPIMLANLGDELDAAHGGLPRSNFRQGERLRFAPPRGVKGEIAVHAPSGRSWRFEPGQPIELGLLREAGEYRLEAGGKTQTFSVQLLAEAESELNARKLPDARLPELAPSARAAGEERSRLRIPLLLALLASCLIAYRLLEKGWAGFWPARAPTRASGS